MKTILLALAVALTGLELWAQTPPGVPGVPGLPTGATPARRPMRFGGTNGTVTQPIYQPHAPATKPAAAPATPAQAEEVIPAGTINFQSADVNQVLEIYSQLVGRTLLRPASLPAGQIVLKTMTPLTKAETIQALQAVLALNGIAVVNIGDKFVKVLPVDQANSAGAELDSTSGTNLPNLGSYITHITQLKYVKPSLIIPLIQGFGKLQGGLLALDDNGILVMRDYAENIKRMLEMIDKIDVSVPAEYISEVIPIRYAMVAEIASALNSLGGSGGGATVSIGSRSGNTPISGVAANRSTGGMGSMGGGGPGGSMGGSYQSGGMGGTTSAFGSRTGLGTTGATGPNGTPTGGSTFQQRLASIVGRAGGAGGTGAGGQDQIQLFGQTKIIPNESSSSLLIYATRQDMEVIKGIISKLDVPLSQVLIEAIIMNVKIGNTFDFGVSAAQKPQNYNSKIPINGAGGSQNGSFMDLVQSLSSNGISSVIANGITNGAFGNNLPGGASWFGNIGPNWDVAVTAAQTDNNANIIQRPRIQTSQAKPAQFFVGDTVPYVTGNSYGGYGGNGVSYSQLSVGVELDVTPFINPDGLVVMDIMQEIDDLNGYTEITGVGKVPNTIKRTLNAQIAVRDRDTVMLGGFIKSDKSHTQSGVPFLMDIPLLGNLFKKRSDAKDRQELIVLIRPTVLKTPELAAKHTIKEEQRLPGVSAAAAEDSRDERKLIDAQSKREKADFKKTGQYDGFFNPLPDENAVPATNVPAADFGTAPQTSAGKPAPAATEEDKARAALDEKMKELDAPKATEPVSPTPQ
jgi:general secretion pathway protein D